MAGRATTVPWNRAEPAPLVLVSGPEQMTAGRAIRRIRETVRAANSDTEVTEFDAAAYLPGELLTASSPSLFGEPRLIIVSNVEKCNDEFLSDALSYIAVLDPEVTLILRHGGGNRGKRLLDAVRATPAAVEIACAAITKDSDRQAFVLAEFAAAERPIAPDAVRALLDAFSGDISELAASCQQLISDVAGPVTKAHVDTYFGGRVEATAFTVADAAIAGQAGQALLTLRHALATGADPVPIVAAFAMKLRLIAKVSGARGSSRELAGALQAAPWQIDRARREAQSWNQTQLRDALQTIAATDSAVKGAERDPEFAVERMVRAIAAKVPVSDLASR